MSTGKQDKYASFCSIMHLLLPFCVFERTVTGNLQTRTTKMAVDLMQSYHGKGGDVFATVCRSDCFQDIWKGYDLISMKVLSTVGHDSRKKWYDFECRSRNLSKDKLTLWEKAVFHIVAAWFRMTDMTWHKVVLHEHLCLLLLFLTVDNTYTVPAAKGINMIRSFGQEEILRQEVTTQWHMLKLRCLILSLTAIILVPHV